MQHPMQQSHAHIDSQTIYQPKMQQQQPTYQPYQTQHSSNAQQQQLMQQQQQIYPPPPHYQHRHQLSDTTAHTSAGILVNKSHTQTMARQSNTVTFAKDTLDATNCQDPGVLYESNKQHNIYKCSTLRHGGKFDSAKPSIQNCPLPAIPTNTSVGYSGPTQQSQMQPVQIKKEGKDGIYSSR